MHIQAVLFDLDGTLADTAPDLGAALNYTRQTQGKPALAAELIRPMASHGARGLLELGFGINPEDAEFVALRDTLLDYYADHVCKGTTLFAGINELIAALAQKGITWGIITNKPERFTQALVAQLPWATPPACVVSGDTCGKAKPDPAPMLYACAQIGVPAQSCLYVGDAERDIQAGNAVGMQSIIAGWGYISDADKPDTWNAAAHIQHPMDLLVFL